MNNATPQRANAICGCVRCSAARRRPHSEGVQRERLAHDLGLPRCSVLHPNAADGEKQSFSPSLSECSPNGSEASHPKAACGVAVFFAVGNNSPLSENRRSKRRVFAENRRPVKPDGLVMICIALQFWTAHSAGKCPKRYLKRLFSRRSALCRA